MSRKILKARCEQLDQLGEDAVFGMYVELGSVQRVVAQIFDPVVPGSHDWGRTDFYRWLRLEPGRWDRWCEAKRDRGHVEADLVHEDADAVTTENASAQRVKIDAHKWRAERLNREAYGPPASQVNVGVGFAIGTAWLDALRGATQTEGTEGARARHGVEVAAGNQAACQQDENPRLPPPSSKEGGGA